MLTLRTGEKVKILGVKYSINTWFWNFIVSM